jgi:hypothetical protein
MRLSLVPKNPFSQTGRSLPLADDLYALFFLLPPQVEAGKAFLSICLDRFK